MAHHLQARIQSNEYNYLKFDIKSSKQTHTLFTHSIYYDERSHFHF